MIEFSTPVGRIGVEVTRTGLECKRFACVSDWFGLGNFCTFISERVFRLYTGRGNALLDGDRPRKLAAHMCKVLRPLFEEGRSNNPEVVKFQEMMYPMRFCGYGRTVIGYPSEHVISDIEKSNWAKHVYSRSIALHGHANPWNPWENLNRSARRMAASFPGNVHAIYIESQYANRVSSWWYQRTTRRISSQEFQYVSQFVALNVLGPHNYDRILKISLENLPAIIKIIRQNIHHRPSMGEVAMFVRYANTARSSHYLEDLRVLAERHYNPVFTYQARGRKYEPDEVAGTQPEIEGFKSLNTQILLNEESKRQNHCVRSYFPSVCENRSWIYSTEHTTLEWSPVYERVLQARSLGNSVDEITRRDAYTLEAKMKEAINAGIGRVAEYAGAEVPSYLDGVLF